MAKQMFGSAGTLVLAAVALGCGAHRSSGFDVGASSTNGAGGPNGVGGGSNGVAGTSGTPSNGALGAIAMSGTMSAPATSGKDKGPSCPGGGSTTISGTVYDPSFQDPLYNITVYVPKSPVLPALAPGASCNSCAALYPEIVASAVTDATGHFVIQDAPPGPNIPLVVQTGKWRKEYTLANVNLCTDNPQPDKSLRLPKNQIHGDGNLPDIAISTGGADSLECLLLRIGVDADEYVGGGGGPGHIHIFTGGGGASTMPASPESFMNLWDTTADMMKNDVLLLSCEGAETAPMTVANQQSLVDYSAAGGRVFASHYHYAWFNTGPFGNANLATWTPGGNTVDDGMAFPGDVITTLANGTTFPEGVALKQWLGVVNALTNGQLPIWFARHNADVGVPNRPPSQPWIALDPTVPAPDSNATTYFSFDTPIGKNPACGRVVYSDLHVSGGPGHNAPGVPADYVAPRVLMPGPVRPRGDRMMSIVPSGCAMHPLTPQEKALEFMIFDLSSCLVPIGGVPMAPPQSPR